MAAAQSAVLLSYSQAGILPAFSGADGAGALVTGGRGGVVYHVTTLDTKVGDNGPGTLQYGINDANFTNPNGTIEPRTIVFDVGGTIWLGRNPTDTEGWDTTNSISIGSNVTIAGQTAPGGITIAGGQLKVNGNRTLSPTLPVANDVIRNITLAPGYGLRKVNSTSGYADNYTYDAMDINSNGVMVDHVSAFFATDETISGNEMAFNTTVQYTSMSQGQNYPQADAQGNGDYVGHAMGNLWSPATGALTTFSHDLYANQGTRIPTIQTVASKLTNNVPGETDFRDNVVYNWLGNAGYGSAGEPGAGNFEDNYYKVGPGGDSASGNNTDFGIKTAAGGTSVFSGSSSTEVYQTGNVRLNLGAGSPSALTNSNFGSSVFESTPFAVPYYGVTDSAATAYNQVLNYVGANWQDRDAIDTRIVNEVRTGTGKVTALDDPTDGYNSAGVYVTGSSDTEWNNLLALRNTANGGTGGTGAFARPANYDTDGDGMPDIWEIAMGLNPNVADNNGNITNDGYTNLDDYLNELGAFPASTPLVFSNGNGTGRYAEIGNWQTGVWSPSRYDQAQLNSGTVTVDVPGQHAGTLEVATLTGNVATLSVSGGWIDIEQSLLVGPGGTGSVVQTGGIVHAGTSVVLGGTDPASYTLSNGTLSTPLLSKGNSSSTFTFTGGTLHADTVAFSLTNQGGILAPGSDLALQEIAAASMPDINDNVELIESDIGNTHVMGNLTLQSGTLQIELASLGSSDTITVDSALSLGGAMDVEPINGFAPIAGSQWLIGTASSITGSFSAITPGYTTKVVGGDLYLGIFTGPSSLTWDTTSGAWDIAASQNWNAGSSPSQFHDGDNVTLEDTLSGASPIVVSLNVTVSPASITVNNTTKNYTISGTGGIAGAGALTKMGSNTLTLDTVNTYSGGTNVSGGALVIGAAGALPNGGVAISGSGTLQLGASTGVANMTSLSITGSGVLDINNNHVVLAYGGVDPSASIYNLLKSGYNGGAWTGFGINSSAAALPANNASYGVGFVDGADGVPGAVSSPGVPLASGQILIAYALYGDVNLDGLVNATDFAIFGANFNMAVTGWDHGDFTYLGLVNATDFALLGSNFGQSADGTAISLPSSDFAALDAFAIANGLPIPAVPEPATGALLALAGMATLQKRRRQ